MIYPADEKGVNIAAPDKRCIQKYTFFLFLHENAVLISSTICFCIVITKISIQTKNTLFAAMNNSKSQPLDKYSLVCLLQVKSYSLLSHLIIFVFKHVYDETVNKSIATDNRGYPHNIFLISLQKHMLWVLIRSASPRHF